MYYVYNQNIKTSLSKVTLKEYVSKMEVCFNEGWISDWMQVNCGECGKVIWVCNFLRDPREDSLTSKKELSRIKKLSKQDLLEELSGTRQFPKDDEKCFICKKKTNHYDCSCSYCGGNAGITTRYICTNKKCIKEDERLHNIWAKNIRSGKK